MSTTTHPPQGLRQYATVVLAAALGFASGPVRADNLPIPQPAQAVGGVESDGFLKRKLNAALAADPVLSRIDLVVDVLDRVAVIGGPVPDPAAIRRAEGVANGVPGLSAVKVYCWATASAPDDPLMQKPIVPPFPGESVLPPLAHAKPSCKAAPVPASPPLGLPPSESDDAQRVAAKVTVDRPAGHDPTGGLLQDPVPVVRRPNRGWSPVPVDAGAGYATIPPVTVPVRPVSEVRPTDKRIAALQAADQRFAGLSVRLRDGIVSVSYPPGRGSDAWALAEALRVIPGVTRVIVQ